MRLTVWLADRSGTATEDIGPRVQVLVLVLVLTTFDLDEYVFEALRVGASGCLLKAAMPDDLRSAIRRAQ